MSEKSKLTAAAQGSKKFTVHFKPWGYALRIAGGAGFWARFAQALSGGFAVVAIGSAVGMWIAPGSELNADVAVLKYAMSGFLVLTGLFALWFATQGTVYELQVDGVKHELREGLRNKKGRTVVLRRIAFDDIRSVVLSREPEHQLPGYARLMLRHKTMGGCLDLLTDKEENIAPLRDILAGDILLGESNVEVTSKKSSKDMAFGGASSGMHIAAQ